MRDPYLAMSGRFSRRHCWWVRVLVIPSGIGPAPAKKATVPLMYMRPMRARDRDAPVAIHSAAPMFFQ